MLSVEFFGFRLGESEHFEIGDGELFLSFSNYLSDIKVGIGLDHTVSPWITNKDTCWPEHYPRQVPFL